MARPRFTGSFTQQLPIPEEGIAAAIAVMRSGRLHRYNTGVSEESEAMALEREYADKSERMRMVNEAIAEKFLGMEAGGTVQ